MPHRDDRLSHAFRGSTRVKRGWYEPQTGKITVQFPDGTRWAYYRCSREEWDGFVGAASAGRYLRDVLERHQNGPAGR